MIDLLPAGSVRLVGRVVEAFLEEEDPVTRALDEAPEDEEPLTEEDIRDLEEAEEAARRGDLIPDEEVWAALEAEGRL